MPFSKVINTAELPLVGETLVPMGLEGELEFKIALVRGVTRDSRYFKICLK